MATAPGRPGRACAGKGRIAVGARRRPRACSRPTRRSSSTSPRLHHKNPVSAYAGRTLTGTVRQTWLRGTPIDLDGSPARPAARGGACMTLPRAARWAAAADRADHRPGRLHRGVRRAPARHDARHRHQPAAPLGRHPAVGHRPAAVAASPRRSPSTSSRSRPAAAATAPSRDPGAEGVLFVVDGAARARPIDGDRTTSCGRAATPTCRPGAAGRCATTPAPTGDVPLDPQGLRARSTASTSRRRS